MHNGIILNKLARIEEYLTKLEEITPGSPEEYRKDWKVQMIAERGLQVVIEIMVDVANRLIAANRWGPTMSSTDSIRLLALKRVITSSEPYEKIIRFRNLIVHGYDRIDYTIVYAILTQHLDDIRKFRDEILKYEQSS